MKSQKQQPNYPKKQKQKNKNKKKPPTNITAIHQTRFQNMHDKIKKPKTIPTQKQEFHTDQNPHNQIQNITYKIKI